jgi:hypothetical protein
VINIKYAIFGALGFMISFAFFEAFWPSIARGIKDVLLFPFVLAADIRRNGLEVLATIAKWSAAIGVLFLIITVFQISF